MLRKALRAVLPIPAVCRLLPAAAINDFPKRATVRETPSPALLGRGDRVADHHLCPCARFVGHGGGVFLHAAIADRVPCRGIRAHGEPYVASIQSNRPCDSVFSFCNTHRVNQDAMAGGAMFCHPAGGGHVLDPTLRDDCEWKLGSLPCRARLGDGAGLFRASPKRFLATGGKP
jgi:hypothetical protein